MLAIVTVAAAMSFSATAEITMETVTYQEGDTQLEGYLAYDATASEKRPCVLIVHEWWGLGEHPKKSAERLAAAGYVGFALDMYGAGKLTEDPQQAGEMSGQFKQDPALASRRFDAAHALMRQHEKVDAERIAGIGYCFGGTIVLEMARLGKELSGVVSFHGGLSSNIPEAERDISCPILVCHGADDPHAGWEEVTAFKDEMQAAKADWQLNAYGDAVHSFTNPAANRPGAMYNKQAAERSWEAMLAFLTEVFSER